MQPRKAKRKRKRGNRYPPGTVIHASDGARLVLPQGGRVLIEGPVKIQRGKAK
jgi:hypothetical protein